MRTITVLRVQKALSTPFEKCIFHFDTAPCYYHLTQEVVISIFRIFVEATFNSLEKKQFHFISPVFKTRYLDEYYNIDTVI